MESFGLALEELPHDWQTHYREIWKKPMTTATPAAPTEAMSLVQFTAAREALRGALAAYERVTPTCHSCRLASVPCAITWPVTATPGGRTA